MTRRCQGRLSRRLRPTSGCWGGRCEHEASVEAEYADKAEDVELVVGDEHHGVAKERGGTGEGEGAEVAGRGLEPAQGGAE